MAIAYCDTLSDDAVVAKDGIPMYDNCALMLNYKASTDLNAIGELNAVSIANPPE